MNLKTKFLLLSIFFLNGCIEATAFMGPAITIGTSGNIYQAGLSYGTNQVVQRTTGKSPIQHISEFLDPQNEHEDNLLAIVKGNIENTRLKIKKQQSDFVSAVNNNIEEEKKKLKNYINKLQ